MQMRPQLSDPSLAPSQVFLTEDVRGVGGGCCFVGLMGGEFPAMNSEQRAQAGPGDRSQH